MENKIFAKSLAERLGQVEKAQAELKNERDMLKSEIENSEAYREMTELIDRQKKERKLLIDGSSIAIELGQKIKETAEEVKELKEILSAELVAYYTSLEADQFEDEDGHIFQIKVTAKAKETKQKSLFAGGLHG